MIQQLTQVVMDERTQRREVIETIQEELRKFTRATGHGAALTTTGEHEWARCTSSEPRPREATQEQTPVQNQGEEDCLDHGEREQREKEPYLPSASREHAQTCYQGKEVHLDQRGKGNDAGKKTNMTHDALFPTQPVAKCSTQQEGGQSVDVIRREKVRYNAQQRDGPAVEALRGEDGRQSEGEALAPGMKEMMDAMRLAYMSPPTFSGGSCGDYWEFRQVFNYHVEATNIPYRMKLKMLL